VPAHEDDGWMMAWNKTLVDDMAKAFLWLGLAPQ
jgi:hypothetical protein